MPRLIEKPTKIDCVGTKPKQIQEYAGRVNSGHAGVSVARMISPSGWEEPGQRPEFAKLDAYLNIDSGTGRARGAGVFGPPSAAAILRQTLAPFQDLGVAGASATRSRTVAGTDSTAFNNAGLPGIGFGQDPIEYNSHTHHTNLDNYERVVESDVRSSAIVIAATLYQLAMRDEMVPRFAPGDMPAPVVRTTSAQ